MKRTSTRRTPAERTSTKRTATKGTSAKHSSTRRTSKVVVTAGLLTACAGPGAGGQTNPPPPDPSLERLHIYEVAPEQLAQARDTGFIEVSGSATVEVPADRGQVAFAVETREETADQAAAANADAMDAVLSALRGGGLPGLRLETFGYMLRPEYSNNTGQAGARARTIVAYVAINNVRATVEDVDQVGRLIDLAIQAGANRVSSISFTASETEDARAQALADAVASARAQGEAIARALGHSLGAALEVHGGADGAPPRPLMDVAMARMEAATTPIEAGDQVVTANVTIRFALGPELSGR